jgi:hypothetical protein
VAGSDTSAEAERTQRQAALHEGARFQHRCGDSLRWLARISSNHSPVYIQWHVWQALLILDSKEQLRLVEPFSKAVLYTESIKHIELIYHTKFSSSLKLPPQPQQHQSKQLPLSHSHSAPNTSSTAAATKKIKRYCYSNSYVAHNGIIFLLVTHAHQRYHIAEWVHVGSEEAVDGAFVVVEGTADTAAE